MASPRVEHLKHHIAAREHAIERRLIAASSLPKHHPVRAHHKAEADRLATEVSAIRATVDFHKPADALASDIERQQVKVEYLLQALKSAKGAKKLRLQRVLEHENRRLREMLAAAKLKAAQPVAAAELPAVALVPDASPAADVAAVAAATGAAPPADNVVHLPPPPPAQAKGPSLIPDAPADPFIPSYRSHERYWSKIPAMDLAYAGADEADDSPWYKHPAVGIGVGLALGWFLAKKV